MLPLVIKLENTKSGTTEAFAFDSSPVRMGRNKLNELCIGDEVVSQWHGLFRFDENHVLFVDLGSTNGTLLNGQRLPRNTETVLSADSVLKIVHVELRVARLPVPPESITRRPSNFAQQAPVGETSMAGSRTMMFRGPIPAPRADSADPRMLAEIMGHTQGVYAQYVQSLEQVTRYLTYYIEQVPEHQRPAMAMALREQMPHYGRSREFRRIGMKAGLLPEQMGDVDIEAWIKRVVFGSDEATAARGLVDTHRALERIGAILEAFAQAFVDLRGGHEQFLSDVGLRLNQEQGGLDTFRSSRGVLAYLLDWSADDRGRIDELNRAFADVALHQVAMINGVVEGVRGILAALQPETIAGAPPAVRSEDVRAGRGTMAGFLGMKARDWWRHYAQRHAELQDGDRFSRDMFGRAFATAYLTIMGNIGKRGPG